MFSPVDPMFHVLVLSSDPDMVAHSCGHAAHHTVPHLRHPVSFQIHRCLCWLWPVMSNFYQIFTNLLAIGQQDPVRKTIWRTDYEERIFNGNVPLNAPENIKNKCRP